MSGFELFISFLRLSFSDEKAVNEEPIQIKKEIAIFWNFLILIQGLQSEANINEKAILVKNGFNLKWKLIFIFQQPV